MKKFFIKTLTLTVAVSTFFLSSSFAQSVNYARVRSDWLNGQLPTKQDILGWHSGRCYPSDDLNSYAHMIVTWTDQTSIMGFQSLLIRNINTRETAVFDKLTCHVQQTVARIFEENGNSGHVPSVDGWSFKFSFSGLVVEVRKLGSRLVSRKTYSGGSEQYCETLQLIKQEN